MDWPRGFAVAAPDLVVRRRLVQRRPTSRSPVAPDLTSDAEARVRAREERSAPAKRAAPRVAALALSLGVHALAGIALALWLGSQRAAEPDAIRVVLLPAPAVAPASEATTAPEPVAPPRPAPVARALPKQRDRARLRTAEPEASVALEPLPPATAPADAAPASPTGAGEAVALGASAVGSQRAAAPLAAFRLERHVAPVYPRSARAAGAEGTSLLRVHVTRSGRVDGIRIERSAGDAALDRAAEAAVRRWRFAAPVPSEDPAGVWVLAPIEFRLR